MPPAYQGRRSPVLPSGMHTPWAGSTGRKISELNAIQGGRAIPLPFILTTSLCTLQPATSASPPYTLAATLDTKPLARSYSGGVCTRLSTNHFRFARARFGYVLACRNCDHHHNTLSQNPATFPSTVITKNAGPRRLASTFPPSSRVK